LWTNDDIVWGQSEQLKRQLSMLDRFGIPGVFFLIPKAGEYTLDMDADLLRIIEKARGNGHEFFQHGYIHTAFESGVPETWMLDFSPPTREAYDTNRTEIEASHSFENMVRMIENGAKIWRKAFKEESVGYRPGWGAYCANLYKALDAMGFQWVSSQICSSTSWKWNQLLWDAPIHFREHIDPRPHFKQGKLIEIPLGGDYAFRVPNEEDKIEKMAQLAVDEFNICHENDWPFICVSHWHGLERFEHSGYAVHERMIPRILETGKAEAIGIIEMHRRARAELEAQAAEPATAKSA
jgi:peptidoglycan/xylan/chitin deacetylase (PgdA/CDA1 family)